jgi:formylglycine-generating enzyme required for sulfatase activity
MSARRTIVLAATLGLARLGLGCTSPGEAHAGPAERATPSAQATSSAAPAATVAPAASPAASATAGPGSNTTAGPGSSAPAAGASPEGMAKIPAGIFLMGASLSHGNPEEQPPHEAIVASFWLDKTEVTLGAYLQCVQAGPCHEPRKNDRFCNANFTDRMDHPVNCIDWREAKAYCAFAGKRLPLEREWEYAAGGGAEHRNYSWGDAEPTQSTACYEHPFGSCPVGSFAPGAFGLYDMTGNVWEWTGSAFKPYPSTPTPDEPSAQNMFFVYRGGSWSRRFPKWMRTTLRNRYEPERAHASLGERCAKSIEPLECPPETEARDGACVRAQGVPICEPRYAWNGTACAPIGGDGQPIKSLPDGSPAWTAAPVDPKLLNVPQASPDAAPVGSSTITRNRTPEYDADCVKHWPGTTTSYFYKGGGFHDRRPLLSAAGCKPRDVGGSWTSACCP